MIPSDEQLDFELFARTYSDRLLRTAYLLTGDAHDAEDVVQAALLRTARRWVRAREVPYPYARQVVVNLVKDRWRYLGRRPRRTGDDVESLDLACARGERDLDRVGQRDQLLRALEALPPKQRAVVVLRYLDDLSIEETARLLGTTTGTVKTHASRGLARLRAALESDAPPPSEREQHHAH